MAKNRSSAHVTVQRKGREKDGNTCQICGFKNHVEGHHIIDHFFSEAANKDNIISLCHNHHRDVHKGLIVIFKF